MQTLSRALDLLTVIRDAAAELAKLLERGIDIDRAADRALANIVVALHSQAPAVAADTAIGALLTRYSREDYERLLRAARRRWESRDVDLPF